MYQIGDRVVYGIHGVCEIVAVEKRSIDRKLVEYFVLEPLYQRGARFYVPTQNQTALGKLHPLLSRQEMLALLDSKNSRRDCWINDEGRRKLRYREILAECDRAELLSMIGCLYRHKEAQAAQGRKFHLCDENFLRDARKVLDSEIALVLDMELTQVGEYLRRCFAD